ncbi:hypothetical protein V5O48_011609 [Marasmius crinis-equi]|uniref:Uncharacterized protein n=1 Tax=Marasmius crinis-equi TaxID=585013 RepID=A0ABR3F529_9AGAR
MPQMYTPMLRRAWCSLSFLLHILLLFLSLPASCTRQLRAIDDTYGDSAIPGNVPTYSPSDIWKAHPGCTSCHLKPDNSSSFNKSSHDATRGAQDGPVNVRFTFTGISLSVFCILPPKNFDQVMGTSGTVVNYNLTFTLDNRPVGKPFIRAQNELTEQWQYNVSVLSLEGLENRQHTFVMQLADGETESVALFDYALYLFDDGNSDSGSETKTDQPQPSRPNIGAIVGGALGSLVALTCAALLLLWVRRRKRAAFKQHQHLPPQTLDPFYNPPESTQPWLSRKFAMLTSTSQVDATMSPLTLNRFTEEPPPAYSMLPHAEGSSTRNRETSVAHLPNASSSGNPSKVEVHSSPPEDLHIGGSRGPTGDPKLL